MAQDKSTKPGTMLQTPSTGGARRDSLPFSETGSLGDDASPVVEFFREEVKEAPEAPEAPKAPEAPQGAGGARSAPQARGAQTRRDKGTLEILILARFRVDFEREIAKFSRLRRGRSGRGARRLRSPRRF